MALRRPISSSGQSAALVQDETGAVSIVLTALEKLLKPPSLVGVQLADDGHSVKLPNSDLVLTSPSLDVLAHQCRSTGKDRSSRVVSPSNLFVCGRAEKGQLGLGPFNAALLPAPLSPLHYARGLPRPLVDALQFVKVSVGSSHVLGLTAHGAVFAWGSNMSAALGLGPSRGNRSTPTEVHGCLSYRVVDIAAGGVHSLIVAADGEVLSCGRNDRGQLGSGDGNACRTPQPIQYFRRRRERLLEEFAVEVEPVAVAPVSPAATTSELPPIGTRKRPLSSPSSHGSDKPALSSDVPGSISRPTSWAAVATDDALVLDSISKTSPHSALGGGGSLSPTQLLHLSSPRSVEEGFSHAAAAGGHDTKRRRTSGVHSPHASPHVNDDSESAVNAAPPANIDEVVAVSAAGDTSFALTRAGRVFAWGASTRGQTATGSTTDVTQPMPVQDLRAETVTSVAAGPEHVLFVTASGALYSAGSASWGKLGLGTEIRDRPNPLRVGGPLEGKRVTSASAGHAHSMAVTDDGQLWAWGDNTQYQLGIPLTPADVRAASEHPVRPVRDSLVPPAFVPDLCSPVIGLRDVSVPTKVGGALADSRVTSVAAGTGHSLAVCADGSVYAWGRQSGSSHLGVIDGGTLGSIAGLEASGGGSGVSGTPTSTPTVTVGDSLSADAAAAASADGCEAHELGPVLSRRVKDLVDSTSKGTLRQPYKLKLPFQVDSVVAGPQLSLFFARPDHERKSDTVSTPTKDDPPASALSPSKSGVGRNNLGWCSLVATFSPLDDDVIGTGTTARALAAGGRQYPLVAVSLHSNGSAMLYQSKPAVEPVVIAQSVEGEADDGVESRKLELEAAENNNTIADSSAPEGNAATTSAAANEELTCVVSTTDDTTSAADLEQRDTTRSGSDSSPVEEGNAVAEGDGLVAGLDFHDAAFAALDADVGNEASEDVHGTASVEGGGVVISSLPPQATLHSSSGSAQPSRRNSSAAQSRRSSIRTMGTAASSASSAVVSADGREVTMDLDLIVDLDAIPSSSTGSDEDATAAEAAHVGDRLIAETPLPGQLAIDGADSVEPAVIQLPRLPSRAPPPPPLLPPALGLASRHIRVAQLAEGAALHSSVPLTVDVGGASHVVPSEHGESLAVVAAASEPLLEPNISKERVSQERLLTDTPDAIAVEECEITVGIDTPTASLQHNPDAAEVLLHEAPHETAQSPSRKAVVKPRAPSRPVRVVSYANLHKAAEQESRGGCWGFFVRLFRRLTGRYAEG